MTQPITAQPARGARQPIRVLLVDDHTVMRAGTRRILEDEPDIVVVGEAGDGREGLALSERLAPDVVALDIGMPGMDGIRMCQALRERPPAPRVLVLTGHDNEAYVRALRKLGVSGYLLKSAGPDELTQAIRAVSLGEQVFSSDVLRLLDGGDGATPRLTPKERDVLAMLAQGGHNYEIAESLSVTVNTLEYHLRNIYMKLGVTTRADALIQARRLGWLDLPDTRL